MPSERFLERSRTVRVLPRVAFAAWLDPSLVIDPAEALTIEPTVGGRYVITAGSSEMCGRFLAVEPPAVVAYTWRWDESEEETVVVVRFTATRTGTTVAVTHGPFLSAESRRRHAEGWAHYLEAFKRRVEAPPAQSSTERG